MKTPTSSSQLKELDNEAKKSLSNRPLTQGRFLTRRASPRAAIGWMLAEPSPSLADFVLQPIRCSFSPDFLIKTHTKTAEKNRSFNHTLQKYRFLDIKKLITCCTLPSQWWASSRGQTKRPYTKSPKSPKGLLVGATYEHWTIIWSRKNYTKNSKKNRQWGLHRKFAACVFVS